MATVLFITKDIGGFNAAYPNTQALRNAGHTVHVVAEGISGEKWEKQGYAPYFKGEVDFRKTPFACDVEGILTALKPDMVITTLGFPINLEARFSEAANRLGIPLGWIEDVWGAHTRSQTSPQLILCFDEIGKEIIGQKRDRFAKTHIETTGDFGLETMKNLAQIPAEMRQEVYRLKQTFKYLVCLAGQGPFTSDMITFLKGSLDQTPELCAVIPRLHPKYKGTEHMAHWQKLLESFPVNTIVDIPGISSDQLAVLCDITWSTFGTGLRYAAYYGNMVVSVLTPATQAGMIEQTGLKQYPLATFGAAVEAMGPVNLNILMDQLPEVRKAQRKYAKPKPFSGEAAVRAIEAITLGK